MPEEKKIINRQELSHEDRLKLIGETSDLSDTGETPDFDLEGSKPVKAEEFSHPFEINYTKEGEAPAKETDEGEGEIVPPASGGEGQGGKLKESIYKNLSEADPKFKEKYKTFDEYMESTAGDYKPAAKTGEEPSPAAVQPVPVLSPEKREEIILEKTYEFFKKDSRVGELLQKIGITEVPTTIDDYADMAKADREKNGSEFYSNQVISLFNTLKTGVTERVQKVEQTIANKDKFFTDATTDFVNRVEKTAKEIYPGITQKDAEPLKTAMDKFYKEAIRIENGKPVHPENFSNEDGIPVPNGKFIYTNFIAENYGVVAGLAKLAAGKGGQKPLKQRLQEQSKNNGKSIKTLGNQGHNSGSGKKVYIDNPKDRQNLSSKDRKAILAALEEESKNT